MRTQAMVVADVTCRQRAGRDWLFAARPDRAAGASGGRGVQPADADRAPRLAGVLAGADCVVAGNTGPAHLAAAVGTPVVSLFAPVVPAERWRPYGVPHLLLGDQDAPCAGSRARRCPVPGHPCLDTVTALDVVAADDKLVEVA